MTFRESFRPLVTLLAATWITVLSFGQDLRLPAWTATTWSGHAKQPEMSWTGNRVLFWDSNVARFTSFKNTMAVYDASTGRCLVKVKLDESIFGLGDLTGACLSSNGHSIFYSTSQGKLFQYAIDSGVNTQLPPLEAVNNSAQLLKASKNGRWLAYAVVNKATNRSTISIYDLTSMTIQRFDMVNPGTAFTSSIGFIKSDTQVVLSGPTIYDLTGKRLSFAGGTNTPVAVSPDETRIYTANANDGRYYAYNSSSLSSPLWSCPAPLVNGNPCLGSGIGNPSGLSVSADGKCLLFGGIDASGGALNGTWYVASVSTLTGKQLPGHIQLKPTSFGAKPYVTASPNSNLLLLGPGSETSVASCQFSTADGSGAVIRSFLGSPTTQHDPIPISVGSTSAFAMGVGARFSNQPNEYPFRNALTGAVVSTATIPGLALSPSGRFYVTTQANTLSVSTVTGGLIDSCTLTNPLSAAVWGGNGRLAVLDGDTLKILSFDGSHIIVNPVFALAIGFSRFRVAPDGTKVAIEAFTNEGVDIFSTTTGQKLANIPSDPTNENGSRINDVSFSTTNLVGIHEFIRTSTMQYFNQMRVYNLATTPPTLVRKIKYGAPVGSEFYWADAVLSPNGQTIVTGHRGSVSVANPLETGSVRLYNVATGAIIRHWENKFIPNLPVNPSLNPAFNQQLWFSLDSQEVLYQSGPAWYSFFTFPTVLKLSLSPATVKGGVLSTATLVINIPSTVATTLQLKSSSVSAIVPATVAVPAGAKSVKFTVTTKPVTVATSVSITATIGTNTSVASLSITP